MRLLGMGIDPYLRYQLGKVRQQELTARVRQAEAIQQVKARHEQLEQEIVSAPVQRRRRFGSLFGRPASI